MSVGNDKGADKNSEVNDKKRGYGFFRTVGKKIGNKLLGSMKTSSEVGGKSISQGFNVKSTKATTFFKKQSPADNKEINGVDGSRVSIEAESQQT